MNSFLDRVAKWPGSTTPDERYDFCDQLCRSYEEAAAGLRDKCREAVAANENVASALLYNSLGGVGEGGFLIEAARRAAESGDYVAYLRRALLAISITDGFPDSRDTLLWLADLWRDAERQGVDPTPH